MTGGEGDERVRCQRASPRMGRLAGQVETSSCLWQTAGYVSARVSVALQQCMLQAVPNDASPYQRRCGMLT